MVIPENIRIGGVSYKIQFVENLCSSNSRAYGHIDFDKPAILLDKDLRDHQGQCITLLHEILHGLCNHFGLEIPDEEKVIDLMAKGLYMVVQDNPEIFKHHVTRHPTAGGPTPPGSGGPGR